MDHGPRTKRNIVWLTCQLVLQVVFTLWLRYRSRGNERLPERGGALLLINHQSFLDPLLVGLPLSRPVSYLARDSLFRVPVIGWVLRHTYVIPINRASASTTSIRRAIERLRQGDIVGIFPEGTRSADGPLGPFKPGFVALVRRAGVPVYPVGIAGANESLPRGARFLRPAKVRVVWGEPLSPEAIAAASSPGRQTELIELARRRVGQCQREAEAWRKRVAAKRVAGERPA